MAGRAVHPARRIPPSDRSPTDPREVRACSRTVSRLCCATVCILHVCSFHSLRRRVTDWGSLIHVAATDAFHDRTLSDCNKIGEKGKPFGTHQPMVVHLHDTVAIDNGEPHSLLRLGQVIETQGRVLKVRCFGRISEFGGASEQAFKDPVSVLPLHTPAIAPNLAVRALYDRYGNDSQRRRCQACRHCPI
jgi:hypothetical protein